MAITRTELPKLSDLRDRYTRDIYRQLYAAGVSRPNVAQGSEPYIRGEAIASTALEVLAKLAALQDATMPDSAVEDDLDRLAKVWRGLYRSLGAGASGLVVVTCTGTVVYAEGQELTAKDGTRYRVTTTTKATSGDVVQVQGIDVGKATNQAAETVLTWTSPPAGSATTCTVDSGGLAGGVNKDDDARFRQRFLDRLQHPAASGNWGDFARWAEESNGAIQKAFVYCAPKGPGTVHVAVACEPTSTGAYTRECNSTLLNLAARNIVKNMPCYADVTVQSVVNTGRDFIIECMLPTHRADGGLGGGWLDQASAAWPVTNSVATYLSGDPPTSNTLRVATQEEPVDDAHIAVWSNTSKKFHHAKIKSHAVVSGTIYDCSLYEAIDTADLASGDYVSPDAEKMDDYGATMAATFASIGPGEKTASALLLPRSYRRPLTVQGWPSSYTSRDVGKLSLTHSEIAHVTVHAPALPSTTTAAATAGAAPKIMRLGRLAFYAT